MINRKKFTPLAAALIFSFAILPGSAAADNLTDDGEFHPATPIMKDPRSGIHREKYGADGRPVTPPAAGQPAANSTPKPAADPDAIDGAIRDTSNMFALPVERKNEKLPGQDPEVEDVINNVKKKVEDRTKVPAHRSQQFNGQ